MDVLEYIDREKMRTRIMLERTMQGMTHGIFNWSPPGTANTISATFTHLLNVEDILIQEVLQNKITIWEAEKFSKKTGIKKVPRIGEDWSYFKTSEFELKPLIAYKDAVWTATDSYLATLNKEALDRVVKFSRGERTIADVIILCASQSLNHAGEIAILKGVQGVRGFPH